MCCSKVQKSEPSYVCLLGVRSAPEYDNVIIGDIFAKGKCLAVFGSGDFGSEVYGKVDIFWNGAPQGKFEKGGIVIQKDIGNLSLQCDLKKVLVCYVIEAQASEAYKVIHKSKIPIGHSEIVIKLGGK